ncbi:hypothetical protein RFI_15706 [Reticulomyxa filosa]|uniref:Membrane transport protein MMPL domain-containing protein n=1 Tax=Reticulomyxa filosa TaxID=46433 RepID=X6N5E9_RETFI|nr:hypothetical protein RFI_15706 [Reticulomyxa filosa]|eukprot:ETO21500.1 hypothetical protein RFI_15706 [Reticulomyxa filosa]
MPSLEEQLEAEKEPKVFTIYFNFLSWKWGRIMIVTWWLTMTILGITYGFDLLNLTNFEFDPPSNSQAEKKLLKGFFFLNCMKKQPKLHKTNLVQKKKKSGDKLKKCKTKVNSKHIWGCTMECNETHAINAGGSCLSNMSRALNESLQKYSLEHDNVIRSYDDIYNAQITCSLFKNHNYTVACYSSLQQAYISFEFTHTINICIWGKKDDGASAIGVIRYNGEISTVKSKSMNNYIKDSCKNITHTFHDQIIVSFTGETPMIEDMTTASRDDVERKDVYTIPLALCVLAVVVRTWRTMFIPLICVFGSICTSFRLHFFFFQFLLLKKKELNSRAFFCLSLFLININICVLYVVQLNL